jgi:hypothetical protein
MNITLIFMKVRYATLVLLALSCAEDLPPPEGDPESAPQSAVSNRAVGDAVETLVDATQGDAWVYFDFERGPQGGESRASDPATSADWDLAFQRFKIKSNGGVSGGGGVEVAVVPDTSLENVGTAPAAGWLLDQPDGDDTNEDPDYAFNQGDAWFDYDPSTHVLQPRHQVYVVLTAGGGYYGVQLLKYYDGAGTGGHVLFHWKMLKPPSQPRLPASDAPATPGGGP